MKGRRFAPRSQTAPRPKKGKFAPKEGKGSHLEERFLLIWKSIGGGQLERELKFHPTRRWKFDFADTQKLVAIEIEGGVFMRRGRHTTATGFCADAEKYNTATMMGWSVIRLPPPQITPEIAAEIRNFISSKPMPDPGRS